MPSSVDLASVVRLIVDPSRAAILLALIDGRALPAGELAYRAGVSAPTASSHLAKLAEAGLVAVERMGRHRYYRLAGSSVAGQIEQIAGITRDGQVRPPRRSTTVPTGLRAARTCYDHLAGRLGVALTDALLADGVLEPTGDAYLVTEAGGRRLAALGVDTASRRNVRRRYAYPCLDWSERRPHLGGALGAALAAALIEQGWLHRGPVNRAIGVTELGRERLRDVCGIAVDALG